MSGGAVLRAKKLTGAGIIRVAAAHNKRTIQSEVGAGGSIDGRRSHRNECLAGAQDPELCAVLAKRLMEAAGIRKLRKDAVRAIEFIVSLAPGQCEQEDVFFRHAMNWLSDRFGGSSNIIAADIHRDEASPHLHLLLLPLLGGRMVGSDALGGRAKLREMQAAFYEAVCAPYGLQRYPQRLSGVNRMEVARSVVAELKRIRDPAMQSVVWGLVRDRIEADPAPFASALGITLREPTKTRRKRLKTMTEIFISTGKGNKHREEEQPYRGRRTGDGAEPYAL